MRRAAVHLVAGCCVVAAAGSAGAQETTGETPSTGAQTVPHAQDAAHATDIPKEHPSLLDRSHTVAEVESGILVLPSAPISPANRGGNTPLGTVGSGDATLQVGVHLLYRADRAWAIGAGATFTPLPTSDPNYGGESGLTREHARSYLTLGGEFRYFPLRLRWIEGWIGGTAGAIIVADRFTTTTARQVPSILGTSTVTVNTEGAALGLQAGADYLITDRLVVGLALGAAAWFLPSQKAFAQENSCDPIGDCPTLTGSVAAFELGLTLGYRIPL